MSNNLELNTKNEIKRLSLAGVLIAVGIAASPLHIPVGMSKCFPVQHFINVLAAVFLGPLYAVGMAFVTSLFRVLLGTGSLLAFPGSMFGALLAGLFYKYWQNLNTAYLGEVVGTGLLGSLAAYPVALLLMGNEKAAIFGYVLPFAISTLGGTLIAAVLITALKRVPLIKESLNGGVK